MPHSSSNPNLRTLLELLASGQQSVDEVHTLLTELLSTDQPTQEPSDTTADVRIDLDRAQRCGFPEVIYAPGKSEQTLVRAFETLLASKQDCLATRCTPEQTAALSAAFPAAICNPIANTVRICHEQLTQGKVVVVTAGTSDRPVAEEACETLRWMHVDTELLMDVGIAGPQRFLQQKHRLHDSQAIIVVAGMEGALPSVVAGWVDCPVIAVPTSVGYGASFSGISALLGMLNSCAANVAVVNIDAGFKAGYLAGMIARQTCSATETLSIENTQQE